MVENYLVVLLCVGLFVEILMEYINFDCEFVASFLTDIVII